MTATYRPTEAPVLEPGSAYADPAQPGRGGVIDPFAYEEAARVNVPRQRGGLGQSAMLGLAAMAAVGATGAAGYAPANENRSGGGTGVLTVADHQAATYPAPATDPGLALTARLMGGVQEPVHAVPEQLAHQVVSQATAYQVSQVSQARSEEAPRREAAAAAEAKRAEQERIDVVGPLVLPVVGGVSSAAFGQTASYWAHLRNGQDFAACAGSPVRAIGEGEITSAGWSGAYGYRVVQTLRDGTEVWYCHLSAIAVGSGRVAPGQPIARVGATGSATRPHLHLEIREAGEPRDPATWFAARGVTL